MIFELFCVFEDDFFFFKVFEDVFEYDVCNFLYFLFVELTEYDDFVKTVEEFRSEVVF